MGDPSDVGPGAVGNGRSTRSDRDHRRGDYDNIVDDLTHPRNGHVEKYVHVYEHRLIVSFSQCDGDSLKIQYLNEEVEITLSNDPSCVAFATLLRRVGVPPKN